MNKPTADKGKCATCGLLALRMRPADPTEEKFWEVSEDSRLSGGMPASVTTMPAVGDTQVSSRTRTVEVCCYVSAAQPPLIAEAGEIIADDDSRPREQAWREVLKRDRRCVSWYPYQPSFGPKWHLEQRQMRDFQIASNNTQKVIARWTAFQALVAIAAIVVVIIVK